MKKTIYTILTAAAILLAGCDQLLYDDSVLTGRVDELESRVTAIEELCAQMNTNISALQTIVTALQDKDYVTGVVPIMKDEKVIGYTISFTKSKPITIYHGEKGDKGDTGAAGHNPVIGVRQDTDGIYYWTLDGEWLTDASGNKIKAVGIDGVDGQNGQNGADAIAPKLKIENDHWWLSTDGGTTWTDLGQAQGDAGQDGVDGDSFFQNVDDTDAAVVFTLADGITTITIPKTHPLGLVFAQTEDIMVVGGTSKTIDFTITGGTAETRVGAIASDGWQATITKNADNVSGSLTVTPPMTIRDVPVSVWVTDNERTIFYALSFDGEDGCLTVTSADSFILTCQAQTFDIAVSTNSDYTIEIPASADWLTVVETRALRTATTTLGVAKNEGLYRKAVLSLKIADVKVAYIAVEQSGSNIIYYTSNTGITIENIVASAFGTDNSIVSHTYENGIGRIICRDEISIIDSSAFYECVALTSITIPESITTIGDSAFYYCSSLTNITIPESVTSIGGSAFDGCSSLTNIAIPDGVTSIGERAFSGCSSLTSITIGNSVTSIGYGAFAGCTRLASITIPDGVTSIGGSAFSGCSSLASITIPNSITSIGGGAFNGCTNLTAVHISDIASWCNISFNDNSLSYAHNLYLNGEPVTNLVIPDSVTSIGYSAFYGCSSITSITIPDSVTTIGDKAFSGCSNLTSITIPDSVTSIGRSAFSGCSSLTSITIPDGVTSIGGSAFSGCSSFASITIPNSVTSIGNYAFSGVTGKITINCTPQNWFSGAKFSEVVIGEGVTSIGSYTFRDCSSLTSVTIGNSVTSIGNGAFQNCSILTNITIPNNVTSIGSYAFRDCSSLASVTIGNGVTSIGNYAFGGCSSLASITIPNSVSSIGNASFNGCSNLASVTIGNGVTSIGYEAFKDCISLMSITIPDSVTAINNNAFRGCSSLMSIYCKATTPPTLQIHTVYGGYWFDNNASGRKIYVPTASVDAYKTAQYWSDYAADIEGYEF